MAAEADRLSALHEYVPSLKAAVGDGAAGWLTAHGWQPEFHEIAAAARRYQREIPRPSGPRRLPDRHSWQQLTHNYLSRRR
jgi:hypothetical protein